MTMITNSSSVPLGTYNSNKIGVGKDTLVNWGYSDVFLGKMNESQAGLKETPNVLWGRAISGTDKEYPTDLAFDFNGLLCVAGGSSRVDLQACKLGTGRRFTTS
jgi:hypothetical protein